MPLRIRHGRTCSGHPRLSVPRGQDMDARDKPGHDAGDAMRYEHYDSLELRDPDARERDFFTRLPDLLAVAMRAPGWARQLAGIDPQAVTSRAALAKLPLLRKSDLATRQKEAPPFGGLNVTAPRRLRRLPMAPGPVFPPRGHSTGFRCATRRF